MSAELVNLADSHATMVVAEELGLKFKQSRDIDYLNAPVDVYRRQLPGGDRFDAVIDHGSLDGPKLISFLGHLSPSKMFGDSAYGTIADWDILDRRYENSSSVAELVTMHQRLGDSWKQFAESQPAFITTLRALGRVPTFASYSYPLHVDLEPVTDSFKVASKKMRGNTRSRKPQVNMLVDLLESSSVENARDLIVENLRAEVSRHSPNHKTITNPQTLIKRFNQMGHVRRSALLEVLVDSLSTEQKHAVLDKLKGPGRGFFVNEDGREFFLSRLLERPNDQPIGEPFSIQEGTHQADFVWEENRSGYLERRMVAGSIRPLTQAPTIRPLISWQRDPQGKRKFIFERQTSGEHNNQFIDGVLGVLAVAYFAPGERATWPQAMRIGESRNQRIMAAQVPVLALMRSAQLLRTDFIEAAEELAA